MSLDKMHFYRYFSFDLSMKLLEQHYPKADVNKAWSEILKYMTSNGFDHRQYSGYISQNKLDEAQTFDAAAKMFRTLKWLSSCAQKFDSTAVINEQYFDFLQEFQAMDTLLVTPKKQIHPLSSNPPKEKREDFLLPKEKSDIKEIQSEKSELTLTPEQFRTLSEAGIEVKVTVNPKDFEKASEILKSTNCTAQASIYKPKR